MYSIDIIKIFSIIYKNTMTYYLSFPQKNELEEVDKIKGTKGDKRLKRSEL